MAVKSVSPSGLACLISSNPGPDDPGNGYAALRANQEFRKLGC